ncbi:MAG TPA: BON domain-containing protein [Methylococcaceae bacterium]|jgi:osmotically-inducible protein OsmY|nr:BON domain-containing protein [Methylococcaceae bacterium]HIA44786.1 BON domain-containing protein [Methylococcaceae bacterium]HIB63115.1 BON domain-containing protein [Methylococcaceae bacterium]HIN69333.1 BON domain-containing protein [Methylococcales bacterium]HIO44207.1 BON domain-containing protein [Methylococcales bacterium]
MTIFRIYLLCTLSLLTGCSQLGTFASEISGLSLLHDRRHSDTIINDEIIEQRAMMDLLSNEPLFVHTHINVTAYNGAILVTGESPTLNLHKKAIAILRIIPGVKFVHDHLRTTQPSSFYTRNRDTFITAKVKLDLANINYIPGFDATRVKVITENATVYLMGLVRKSEAKAVINRANKISGVNEVIQAFEYID